MTKFKYALLVLTMFLVNPAFASLHAIPAGGGPYPWPYPWAVNCSMSWQSLSGLWSLGNMTYGSQVSIDVVSSPNSSKMEVFISRSDDNGVHSQGARIVSRHESFVEIHMQPRRAGLAPYTLSVGMVYTSSVMACDPYHVATILMINEPKRGTDTNGSSWVLESQPQ